MKSSWTDPGAFRFISSLLHLQLSIYFLHLFNNPPPGLEGECGAHVGRMWGACGDAWAALVMNQNAVAADVSVEIRADGVKIGVDFGQARKAGVFGRCRRVDGGGII